MAYHGMAIEAREVEEDSDYGEYSEYYIPYRGSNREEDLLSSLEPLEESLVEPAIFLAGITGWRCQSDDGRNHWEMYLSHDTAGVSDPSVLLCSSMRLRTQPSYHTISMLTVTVGRLV